MRLRFPLYAKILGWLALNLAALAVAGLLLLRVQFHLGLDWLISGRNGERAQAVAEVIAAELAERPREEWDHVLERFQRAYGVRFLLFRNEGAQMAGGPIALPGLVAERLRGRPGPPPDRLPEPVREPRFDPSRDLRSELAPEPGRPAIPAGGEGARRPGEAERLPPGVPSRPRPGDEAPRESRPLNRPSASLSPGGGEGWGEGASRQVPAEGMRPLPAVPGRGRFMIRAGEPPQYWVGVRLPPPDRRTARGPVTVLIVSDSLRGGGLFFDATPWVLGALGVLGFTALFWFPFVRGITVVIGRMTRATEQIAAGQFDARLEDRRADELGRLSDAINRMAARLAGYVTGQKRFLGDIAHELCSPLARIQMALGILEQRADDRQRAHVEGVREEVQHMSQLVAELLSFSRASLKPQEVRLRAVNLAEIARRVVTREAGDTSPVTLNVPEDLAAQAEPELLTRALANVLRNAIRYAGHAGPITLSARREDDRVVLQVADAGPGVPDKAIGQLFQPFYRPDAARGRDTGGAGLGLAIVKSCVDACQGTVTCRNLAPSGFAVEISLQACAPQAA